jgi:soluble lytic murein transglycosylase
MPADLWIESVPFQETRTYLRRVFAYTAIYENRLGEPTTRLSDRLPPIPARVES